MIYLDASAAVSQFAEDAHTTKARSFFGRPNISLIVSDFCIAEFIAAIAQQVRARRYTPNVGRMAINDFEIWVAASANRLSLSVGDVDTAIAMLRRFELKVRTPDALHLAICKRAGAQLLSFDKDQIAAGRELGIPIAD